MIRIYLVRHGQTEENLQRIFQGHLPGVLTKEGRLQAVGLHAQLVNLPLDAVVSSDLQRVVDTVCLAFGGDPGIGTAVETEHAVETEAESVAAFSLAGGKLDKTSVRGFLWHCGRKIPWERTRLLREIDWGSWTGLEIASVDTTKVPSDAESKEMLYERAGYFVKYLKQYYEGKTVLVVGHGLVNRSIQAQLEGVGIAHLHEVPHMKNAEIREFSV